MEQILDQARTIWEGEIDFAGQRLAELLSTALLSITGVIAFLAGWLRQDIYTTVYIGLAGSAITALAVVPPWPFYNRDPQPWLPARKARPQSQKAWSGPGVDLRGVGGIQVDGARVG